MKTKAIEWYITHGQQAVRVEKKSSKTKTARMYAPSE
jgi:hypothetical protein